MEKRGVGAGENSKIATEKSFKLLARVECWLHLTTYTHGYRNAHVSKIDAVACTDSKMALFVI